MSNQVGFNSLGLNAQLKRAVHEAGYTDPTPIQIQTIPPLLAGHDLIGCAQTGTGKTAAFALPILQLLSTTSQPTPQNKRKLNSSKKHIRVLVLSPTRELAIQIGDSFSKYGQFTKNFTNTVIFGGVKAFSQIKALKSGVDILVATPGRLLDLINQGFISLQHIEILVFDEADRMLDMGFIHDVRRIMKTVSKVHQTMLFSATMPKEIVELAKKFLHNPVKISVTPDRPTVEIIDQTVYFVEKKEKQDFLNHLVKDPKVIRALVFSRTKHGANKIVRKLIKAGIQAEPIHGNKSQNARQLALKNFREGTTRILVATDVAARGIDVENITHVIQFNLPHVPETYVHRIGRTGRAGAGGIAIAFCATEERSDLQSIQKLIRMKIPVVKLPKYEKSKMSDIKNTQQPDISPKQSNQSKAKKRTKRKRISKAGKKINSIKQLDLKKAIKKGKRKINCSRCSRTFESQGSLSQHMKFKHNSTL